MFNLFSAFGGIFFSFPLTAAISGLLCESVKGIKRRYSLRCKLKVNFSEAVAYIIHVLLHLSLLLLRISLPSPILCYTSDVRALSEWVWWWRSLPPCIVGNVRVSLHCCKYEVLQSEPSLLGEDFLRFKKKKKKSTSSSVTPGFVTTSDDLRLLHFPGGCVVFFMIMCLEEACAGLQGCWECAHDTSLKLVLACAALCRLDRLTKPTEELTAVMEWHHYLQQRAIMCYHKPSVIHIPLKQI